jgi:hypothetical protein
MICNRCKKDMAAKDFLLNQPACYKCIYQEKIKKQSKKKTKCRECRREIKEFFRRVYCSEECAHVGHMKQNQGYWTRNVHATEII